MAHEHGPAPDASDPGDAEVCVCFHVKRRKIEAWCRREKPKVVSLISQCLSAGTGCGWCVPFLTAIRDEVCAGGARVDLPTRAEYLAKRREYHHRIGYAKPDAPA